MPEDIDHLRTPKQVLADASTGSGLEWEIQCAMNQEWWRGYHTAKRMAASTVNDIRPHFDAWVKLLTAYVNSLPPDIAPTAESEGRSDRSYAEHELNAMKRDLGALFVAIPTEQSV